VWLFFTLVGLATSYPCGFVFFLILWAWWFGLSPPWNLRK